MAFLDTLTPRQFQILKETVDLISARGPGNFTMKDVADAVGISDAAIYRHFKSKTELLDRVLDFFEADTTEAIERHAHLGFDGIRAFIIERMKLISGSPVLARMIFMEEDVFVDTPRCRERTREITRGLRRRLRDILVESRGRGEIRRDIEVDLIYVMIFGPVRSILKMWRYSDHSFDLVAKVEKFWEAIRLELQP